MMRTGAIVFVSALLHCLTAFQIPLVQQQGNLKKANDPFIQSLVEQMTMEELALQLDMYQGSLITNHGEVISTKEFEELLGNGRMMGTVHDFKAPLWAINKLQEHAINNTRLKIPVMIIEECLHGILYENRTVFPQAIALAATFNTQLIQEVGHAIGQEARASGIHFCLSPVLDLARDPRWGRVEEGYGECPYLTSQMAVAMVSGMQNNGNLSSSEAVIAEVKHFTAHGSPAGGRNTAVVKDGRREVYSSYLVPFREAVVTGGSRGIMAAYNEIDGIPNAANYELLTGVLRESWGFKGVVVSDLGAIAMLHNQHHVSPNAGESLKQFHTAGGNVQFYDVAHDTYLKQMVMNMESDPEYLTIVKQRVAELLNLKKDLGLFDDPILDPSFTERHINTKATQQLSLDAARQSIILLKNSNKLLPLNPGRVRRIAVIGPNAATLRTGDYSPDAYNDYRTSILDGIIKRASQDDIQVEHIWGCDVTDGTELVVVPSNFLTSENGEPGLTAKYLNRPGDQPVFTRVEKHVAKDWYLWSPFSGTERIEDSDNFYVTWNGTLTPDATVDGYLGIRIDGDASSAIIYIDGRPYSQNQANLKVYKSPYSKPDNLFSTKTSSKAWVLKDESLAHDMIIWGSSFVVPYAFKRGKSIRITIKYTKRERGGRVYFVWNLVGQSNLQDAYKAAKRADVAVVVVGDNDQIMGEGRDRLTLRLFGKQRNLQPLLRSSTMLLTCPSLDDLIQKVYSTGTPVILVLSNGRPPAIPWEAENIPVIVETFYAGQSGGQALADVLFGDYNPAGRLPITFPRDVGAIPLYYNGPPTFYQNGYLDGPWDPVFPFGYGLSYTSFKYENFDCFPKVIDLSKTNTTLQFTLTIWNTGRIDGEEVVQLYRLGHVSSVTVPRKQLFGFRRVFVKRGGHVLINFSVDIHQWLGVWDRGMEWTVEPGERTFVVGPNSLDEWASVSILFK